MLGRERRNRAVALLNQIRRIIEGEESPVLGVYLVDSGYYANKAGADYPAERVWICLSYKTDRGELKSASGDEAEDTLPDEFWVAYELACILFDCWLCGIDIQKDHGELSIDCTMPFMGGSEIHEQERFDRALKFLRLGVWYGDIGQFALSLSGGDIDYARFREGGG